MSTMENPDPISRIESEKARVAVRELIQHTGRVFIQIENPWFGNQKFGQWESQFFVDVKKTTGKAVLGGRVTMANEAIKDFVRGMDHLENEGVESYAPLMPGGSGSDDFEDLSQDVRFARENLIRAVRKCRGDSQDRRTEAWLPKSQIELMVSGKGAEVFKIFEPGKKQPRMGSIHDGEVVIRETITVSTRWRKYQKLAIDADYEPGQVISDLDWDEYHPSPEYDGDDFVCWTADQKPREVISKLNDAGWSVAIHQKLLD